MPQINSIFCPSSNRKGSAVLITLLLLNIMLVSSASVKSAHKHQQKSLEVAQCNKKYTDIDRLCSAFATQSCGVWTGSSSSGVRALPSACGANAANRTSSGTFTLICAETADALSCGPKGQNCLGLFPSSKSPHNYVFSGCRFHDHVELDGSSAAAGSSVSLVDVSISGTLSISKFNTASLRGVRVVSTDASRPAVSLKSVSTVTGTSLSVRHRIPKGQESAESGASCLSVSSGVSLSLSSLDLRDCVATSYGGCVYVGTSASLSVSGSANLANCTSGLYGGGLYVGSQATATFGNLFVSECTATTRGGGIYALAATVSATYLSVSSCSSVRGGGIYASSTTISADDFEASSCSATYGGAVYASSTALSGTTGTLSQDSASYAGGGLYLTSSTASFTTFESIGCSQTGTSGRGGGAIYAASSTLNASTWIAECDTDAAVVASTMYCTSIASRLNVESFIIDIDDSVGSDARMFLGEYCIGSTDGVIYTDAFSRPDIEYLCYYSEICHDFSFEDSRGVCA